MNAEERAAVAKSGMAMQTGVLKPDVQPSRLPDEERRAAVEELIERSKEMEKDWDLYRQTCEEAAVAFLDACSLEPTRDAVLQLTEAFLPALAIMCQRGTIYDQNGGSWKAMGWKGVLLEVKKRWSRVRISAWKNNRYNPGDATDAINYLGYYIRGRHEGPEFGEMDE
jgi:hypothetical protein